MTITAKYPGTCSKCGEKINVGEQIEWSKSGGAVHVRCARGSGKSSAMAAERKPVGRPDNAQNVERRSTGKGDGYTIGDILHAPRIDNGGGPDRHYWKVIDAGKYRDDDTDGDDVHRIVCQNSVDVRIQRALAAKEDVALSFKRQVDKVKDDPAKLAELVQAL